jgi:hypothetical protein
MTIVANHRIEEDIMKLCISLIVIAVLMVVASWHDSIVGAASAVVT